MDIKQAKLGDLYRESARLSFLARSSASAAWTAQTAGHPRAAARALEIAAAHAIEASRLLEQLAKAFQDECDDVLEPELT